MKQLKLRAAFLIILLIVSMSFGIIGVQAAEPKIPNPTAGFYFNDFAKVLDSDMGRDIVRLGEATFKTTNGGQVVFVSIDTLDGNSIEEYANALFNKWKIGTKDKGILFILSMQERESRIEVGYGYEGVLTDLESNKLLIKFSELNKEKGMDEAVKAIYTDICSIVSGDEESVQYPRSSAGNSETRQQTNMESSFVQEHPILTVIMAIIVLILIILDFILTGGRVTFFILRMAAASARRGGGGGGRNSGGGGRSGGGGSSSRF